MKKIIKTIKSIFSKNKYPCYIDCVNTTNMVYNVIINQVRLVNVKCYKYLFSIIPTKDNIIIKCQTSDNVYNSLTLNLIFCNTFQEDELINYVNKHLEALIKETACSFNCYKAIR